MKYQKPEVHVISTATKAIESVQTKVAAMLDSINQQPLTDGPAYEADE
jgi:hypothetical protein